jgi:oxygen-dependent protoporphyrinogen oxidase
VTLPARVVVVGAGVAGLAAAHRLYELAAERGSAIKVTVCDAAWRPGGTVASERTDGFVIEQGADSFITEKPWATALCQRLGITGDLIATREGERRTWVVHKGRLHPLPEGFLMLGPTEVLPVLRSDLFSWAGKLRMGLDLVLPRGRGGDESLGSFVRRRLGREALERVADPLVGGIYTADPERLSLAATMPRFLEMERRHRSIILGLRERAAEAAGTAGARYGLFASHARGMGALIDALVATLPRQSLRLGAPVEALGRVAECWRVQAGGETLEADAVIVAVPAWAAARLLEPLDARIGQELRAIEYASSAAVSLAFPASAVAGRLPGFGFVVPAVEGRTLIACTFSSRKYAGRAPDDHELLRAYVGGARRPEMAEMPEAALIATVRDELRLLLGITAEPTLVRVHRHARAMPQYAVGHLDRVADIEGRVASVPGLAVAGAAYRGVGIPDCVRSGEAAAEAIAR